MTFLHQPVLLQETLDLLDLRPGDTVVDCTLGGGGHTKAIWERLRGQVRMIGIDQDERAIRNAEQNLPSEITVVRDNFRNLKSVLLSLGLEKVDRILFDLGVSSPQLDEGERGFSYQADAALDMRMDRRTERTAAHLVNQLPQDELAKIIYDYAEERWAKRIAEFIVAYRQEEGTIETTGQLVDIIKRAIPAGARKDGPHPAKRTFQALRIAVNGELDLLQPSMAAAVEMLSKGGRLAVITFHSLEDRLVKHSFKDLEQGCVCPPRLPVCICGKKPQVKIVTKKPMLPSEQEVRDNPRARSAKLRVAEKC